MQCTEEIICNVRPSSYVIRNTVHVFVFLHVIKP